MRLLLGCVVEFIRLKARLFREQQVREEREFRMRTARRRVKEDCQFKEWVAEQREFPTFPMKPDSVAVISPRLLNVLQQQPQQQAHSSSVSGNTTAEVKKENFKVLFDNSILAAPKVIFPSCLLESLALFGSTAMLSDVLSCSIFRCYTVPAATYMFFFAYV